VLLVLSVDVGRLLGLGHLPADGLLALVVCGTLDLPALLETVYQLVSMLLNAGIV
jgi:hypothetical protein